MSRVFPGAWSLLVAGLALTALLAGCGQSPSGGASSARTPIAAAAPPVCPRAAPLACPSPPKIAPPAAQSPPAQHRRRLARSEFHSRRTRESSRSFSSESVHEEAEGYSRSSEHDHRDELVREARGTYAYAGLDERGFLVWPGKVEY